jgi:hypothetical protein
MEIKEEYEIGLGLGIGIFIMPYFFSWVTLKSGYSTKARVISFGWLAFIIIVLITGAEDSSVSRSKSNNQSLETVTASAPKASPVKASPVFEEVDLKTLNRDYDQNEARADRDHKGKTYLVNSTVAGIDQDIFDNTVILLSGINQFLNIHAKLKQNTRNIDKAIELNKGQSIKLICYVEGELMGGPRLTDCRFP